MTLNDEQLRLAYASSSQRRAPADRVACPAPEALLAVVERTGHESVRLETLDHAMMCDRCRRDLDLIRASAGAAGVPRPRTWFRSPSVGLMALAASLLAVAGVRLYMTTADAESGPRLRGGAGIVTHPVARAAGGVRLAWRPPTGAMSYRLEVLQAGRAVLDTTMRDTSFVVSDSLVGGSAEVSWTVSAILDDGTTVSSLPSPLRSPSR